MNMAGNTTVNQPITSTIEVPRTKQEQLANALKYIRSSGNTELASKAVLGDIENMFKAPETNLGKVEIDKFTPPSIAKFRETGNYNDLIPVTKDVAPTVRTMRVGTNEVTQQYNPETKSWVEIAKGPAFKPEPDLLGLNGGPKNSLFVTPPPVSKTFTEQDIKDTATSTGKSEQQVRQDLIAKGWKAK
jgi:hypothetical protein